MSHRLNLRCVAEFYPKHDHYHAVRCTNDAAVVAQGTGRYREDEPLCGVHIKRHPDAEWTHIATIREALAKWEASRG